MTWMFIPSPSCPSAWDWGDWSGLSSWLAFHRGLSLGWKGKPTPPLSWRRAWNREGWTRHLSGMTLPSSTADRGVASWMSSLRATRASRTLSQGRDGGQAMSAGSGMTSGAWFAKWSPASSGWRTCQGTFLGRSDEYSETWPRAGGLRNGTAFLRRPSVPLTSAIGSSSLLPTPTAQASGGSGSAGYSTESGRAEGVTLTDAIVRGFLPTPTAADGHRASDTYARGNHTLMGALREILPTPMTANRKLHDAALLPTPTASLGGKGSGESSNRDGGPSLLSALGILPTPTSRDWKSGKSSEATRSRNARPLNEVVLPTPTAKTYGNNRGGAAGRTGPARPSLETLARHMLPTPRSSGSSNAGGSSSAKVAKARGTFISGYLSPYFVEWMMAIPVGWTELVPTAFTALETPLSMWQPSGPFVFLPGGSVSSHAPEAP